LAKLVRNGRHQDCRQGSAQPVAVVVLVSVTVTVVVPQLQLPLQLQVQVQEQLQLQPPQPQPQPQPSLSACITSVALVCQRSSEPRVNPMLAAMKERASLPTIPSMPCPIIGKLPGLQ
jgi:hypothetical protein